MLLFVAKNLLRDKFGLLSDLAMAACRLDSAGSPLWRRKALCLLVWPVAWLLDAELWLCGVKTYREQREWSRSVIAAQWRG